MKNSSVEDINFNCNSMYVNGILMDFSTPQIMGILNVTADSFFEGSRLKSESELLRKAEQHLFEGASILDLGGFSTRPNAIVVQEELEISRIENAVKALKKEFPKAILSVDTFRASVAQVAIDQGVGIINDISGFQFDSKLLDVVAKGNVAYVLMHVEGTLETMHELNNSPRDIIETVSAYFQQKIEQLNDHGIENIILDPGFGFSKSMEENHELLHRLDALHGFDMPLLVGISRKSMIYKKLEITPEESLNGTTVLNTIATLKGAGILRVHDVKACKEVIDLLV